METCRIPDLHGNNAKEEGAVVVLENNSSCNISFCLFQNNSAQAAGVILLTDSSTLNADNSYFINNRAHESRGGAIMVRTKTKTFIYHSIFINNTAMEGGAFFGDASATLTLMDSSFNHNSAIDKGGALALRKVMRSDIFRCEFTDNMATVGGAIFTAENVIIHIQSSLFDNHTASEGAAVFLELNSSLKVNNSTFIHNKASEWGGGIVIQKNATGKFFDSYFGDNVAKSVGGAIFTSNITVCQLATCHFKDNSASQAGAIHAQVKVALQIDRSIFEENHADFAAAIAALFQK